MSKSAIFLDMDDVPHLGELEKKKILAGVPSWQLQARKSGIPGHGVGAIYPIPEDVMKIAPFDIPAHWPRSYGMDPGWNFTAVVWFGFERRRFQGPPVGQEVERRQAAIDAAEQALRA